MRNKIYDKPFISIQQQIEILDKRGLKITDEQEATHFLTNISYYRLAGYWWDLQKDKAEHKFKDGVTFDMVIARYNFDRSLKLLLFDVIERIEIGLRTMLIYELSKDYGPWWFVKNELFHNDEFYVDSLKEIKECIQRSKDVFMKIHKETYNKDRRLPPAWKTFEVLTFSSLSKIYANLESKVEAKDRIADKFGLDSKVFVSWLHSIAIVRNIIAHHGRLWNRSLVQNPAEPKNYSNKWVGSIPNGEATALYIRVCCLKYLIDVVSPGSSFRVKLIDIIDNSEHITLEEMSFPLNWKEQPLWIN